MCFFCPTGNRLKTKIGYNTGIATQKATQCGHLINILRRPCSSEKVSPCCLRAWLSYRPSDTASPLHQRKERAAVKSIAMLACGHICRTSAAIAPLRTQKSHTHEQHLLFLYSSCGRMLKSPLFFVVFFFATRFPSQKSKKGYKPLHKTRSHFFPASILISEKRACKS